MLDTVQPAGDSWAACLDAEQRAWLEAELGRIAGQQPVIIFTHMPILSVTMFTYDNNRDMDGVQHIPTGWMMRDGASIHYLLREHPHVRLSLSGHTHLLDRSEIDGVTYICGGAVCANWWEGPLQKVDEGYGVIHLYDDGHFDFAYTPIGWNAVA